MEEFRTLVHHYCGSPRDLGAVFPNVSVAALKITASEQSQVDTRPWECSHCLAIPIAGVDRQQPIWSNWASVEMGNWTEAVVSRDGPLNAAFSDFGLFLSAASIATDSWKHVFSPPHRSWPHQQCRRGVAHHWWELWGSSCFNSLCFCFTTFFTLPQD